MIALLRWAWEILDPPPPPQPPIIERHLGLRCGTTGVAEGWTDLTHLGRVHRARLEANEMARYRNAPLPLEKRDGTRGLYELEAPDVSDRWLPWLLPARVRPLRLTRESAA